MTDETTPTDEAEPAEGDDLEPAEPEPFEQATDDRGRVRLDRPLTGGEARAQDERNRERFLARRRRRFAGRLDPR